MIQQLRASLVSVIVLCVLTGIIFPYAITGIARVLFPNQAAGSLVKRGDTVVGSTLIAQGFTQPGYFHPRQSAAGNGYDPTSSGGTNLGPTSDKLINGIHKKTADGKDDPSNFDGIKDLAAAYRTENSIPATTAIPADAATRSASGLDPEISPENAALQAPRVAKARNIDVDQVQRLIEDNTAGRQLGFLGEPRVNVLNLNMALDKTAPMSTTPKK